MVRINNINSWLEDNGKNNEYVYVCNHTECHKLAIRVYTIVDVVREDGKIKIYFGNDRGTTLTAKKFLKLSHDFVNEEVVLIDTDNGNSVVEIKEYKSIPKNYRTNIHLIMY